MLCRRTDHFRIRLDQYFKRALPAALRPIGGAVCVLMGIPLKAGFSRNRSDAQLPQRLVVRGIRAGLGSKRASCQTAGLLLGYQFGNLNL
ncbi:MAG: hypothetical protein JO323_03705 [Acidobacteriia bacterium]|nr:hypothetical protein [Terriglobia bacterium]